MLKLVLILCEGTHRGNNFQTGNPDFCAVNPALG